MKVINLKLFLILTLVSLSFFKSAIADVIDFDITTHYSYTQGLNNPIVFNNLPDVAFSTSVYFDLMSDSNLNPTQNFSETIGKTLGIWTTTFSFDQQAIFTPYEEELLSGINENDYDYSSHQYVIEAIKTFDYTSSIVEEIINFRYSFSGLIDEPVNDGALLSQFLYQESFIIELPTQPQLSFDEVTYFDSTSVKNALNKSEGTVRFSNSIIKNDTTYYSQKSPLTTLHESTYFIGSGTYQTIQEVPTPSTLSIFTSLALLFGLLRQRKKLTSRFKGYIRTLLKK